MSPYSNFFYPQEEIDDGQLGEHFGPFLLANLLLDIMNKGGRIIMTASGLHDKATFGEFKGVTLDETTGNAVVPTTDSPLLNLSGSNSVFSKHIHSRNSAILPVAWN